MTKQETTTDNFADFGYRERQMLLDILQYWQKNGLPEDFDTNEVKPEFNRHSGYVFLVNSEYQVAMMNGDKLEIWHNCPNCGLEGFAEDCQLNDEGCEACHPCDQ
jgi:hypothetical protein